MIALRVFLACIGFLILRYSGRLLVTSLVAFHSDMTSPQLIYLIAWLGVCLIITGLCLALSFSNRPANSKVVFLAVGSCMTLSLWRLLQISCSYESNNAPAFEFVACFYSWLPYLALIGCAGILLGQWSLRASVT